MTNLYSKLRQQGWLAGLIVFTLLIIIWLGISCGDLSGPGARHDRAGSRPFDFAIAPDAPEGFNLLITGNWQGSLRPCGCTEKQLGGIDRRTALIHAIAPQSQSRLLIDAGPLIHHYDRQDQIKLQTFLYSLKALTYDSVGLTPEESIMAKQDLALASEDSPVIVCSNMSAESSEDFQTSLFVEKTLVHGDNKLQCLILSLAVPGDNSSATSRKVQLEDPVEAIRSILGQHIFPPAEKATGKVTIVTLSAEDEALVEELRKIPQIDILVVIGHFDEPQLLSQPGDRPMVITTGLMGKYLTRIVAPFNNPQKLYFSFVPVESSFPRDPAIISLIDDYQMQLQMENLIADENILPRRPLPEGNRFVGSATCGQSDCHEQIYAKWRDFKHGHAFETLQRPEVNSQYDPECVVCHTVGMKYQTGFRSLQDTPQLAGVGCESCHGPGLYHVHNNRTIYRDVFTSCETCHDHDNSPEFAGHREEYFSKIRHWTEPREYWP